MIKWHSVTGFCQLLFDNKCLVVLQDFSEAVSPPTICLLFPAVSSSSICFVHCIVGGIACIWGINRTLKKQLYLVCILSGLRSILHFDTFLVWIYYMLTIGMQYRFRTQLVFGYMCCRQLLRVSHAGRLFSMKTWQFEERLCNLKGIFCDPSSNAISILAINDYTARVFYFQ